ncbi:recombinase-like helix-turn-helix domain-containing protein [Marinobacterium aestuariivivens]|uniref:Recombinase-like helix-turn-helix domain-containing protein n=1 Tax=Marinobacterium aestuariivivens TaxID=1698799 RepID=A0ABW1ZXI9_9GAMM
MTDYNPKLATWLKNEPCTEAGINNIQVPGRTGNIIWQTRHREPSRYEQALVEHLEAIFATGVVELESLVEALNARGSRTENSAFWTAESFQAEMARLGY